MSRNLLARAAIFAAILATAGCGVTARSGPTGSAILSPGGDPTYRVIEVTAATIGPYIAHAADTGTGVPQGPRAEGFTIAPGDVLSVVVFERSDGGLFAPAAAGGTPFPNNRVDEAGTITLPYAGRVRVAGASLAVAAQRVVDALAGTAIDPRAHVQLVGSPLQSVMVVGEVRTPGRVSLLEGPLSALDAIARAGGPSQPGHSLDVVIEGRGAARRLSYLELLAQPSLRIAPGDRIIIRPNENRFLAMGALRQPGLKPMTMSRMSLLDGIAASGGLIDLAASPSGVFVFRLADRQAPGGPEPTVFHLDLARGEAMFLAHRFALRADDIVFVSNAPLWEVQKVVAPFVQLLTLGAATAAAGG